MSNPQGSDGNVDIDAGAPISRRRMRFDLMKRNSRRKLLDAACTLFVEQGYEETAPRHISRLAGVGAGTFYLHFENKHDCFAVLSNEINAQFLSFARDYVSATKTFPEALSAILNAMFDYAQLNPAIFGVISADSKVLFDTQKMLELSLNEEFLSQFKRWQEMGNVNNDIDSDLLIYLTMGILRKGGVFISANLAHKDQICDQIVRFVISGISPILKAGQYRDCWLNIGTYKSILYPDRIQTNIATHCNDDGGFGRRIETRQKLLAAARVLFAERGYHGVGPEEIALCAGFSTATFYLYFKDKLDCYIVFANNTADEINTCVQRCIINKDTLAERLFATLYVSIGDPFLSPGIVEALFTDFKSLSKNTTAANHAEELTVRRIEQWRETGEVETDIDRELLHHLVRAVVKYGEAFIIKNPHQKEKILQGISLFLLQALGAYH